MLKGFDVDIRPLKNTYGIPISEVDKDSFQMRSDGVLVNGKLHIWESLLEVRIRPLFCEHEGELKNGICLECGEGDQC